jgi:REP element-mobilizing transposase RayT
MPRSPRADEGGGLYHALNRGNLRAEIFKKQEDYVAFEKILAEAVAIHQVQLFGYLLMPNHYHLVLRPLADGEMSRFMGWVGGTNTMRYHGHYHTSGMGTFISSVIRAFPFKMTITSLLSAAMSKAAAAPCSELMHRSVNRVKPQHIGDFLAEGFPVFREFQPKLSNL